MQPYSFIADTVAPDQTVKMYTVQADLKLHFSAQGPFSCSMPHLLLNWTVVVVVPL